jgi:hypothetical protein
MIGFIGTSLQLQSIITAHTFNSFWMHYDSSLTNAVWRISLTALNARMNSLWLVPCGPAISHQLIVLCYSVRCHGNLVFRNFLPGNHSFIAIRCSGNVETDRCSAMDVLSGSTIPASSRHVTIYIYIYISKYYPGIHLKVPWRIKNNTYDSNWIPLENKPRHINSWASVNGDRIIIIYISHLC